MFGKVNNRFFPNCSTEPVGEIVYFVHDDVSQTDEGRRFGVEHVAKDFGSHDDDGGFGIDAGVTGEQTHVFFAVFTHKIMVFLVAECFDRGCVERFCSSLEGKVDAEFSNNCFASTGGRSNKDCTPGFDGLTCLTLEAIKGEPKTLFELPKRCFCVSVTFLRGLILRKVARAVVRVVSGFLGVFSHNSSVPAPKNPPS